jgi:hypothetical protein
MTATVDTSGWKAVGETENTRYFELGPKILAAVPRERARDDEATARSNVKFQVSFLRERGGGVVVVFFDNMVSQDKDARRVYQMEPDPAVLRATALVGGSLLSRAMGSFFLGLAKPRIPVKMFATTDEAVSWANEVNGRSGDAKEASA